MPGLAYYKQVLLCVTVVYLPVKFLANKPPPFQDVRKPRRMGSDDKPYTQKQFQQHFSDNFPEEYWEDAWDNAEEEKTSVSWESFPAKYCTKRASLDIRQDGYGFFKKINNERCRDKCGQNKKCKAYSFGEWKKVGFSIFGIFKYGSFYGQWRCQLFEECDLQPVNPEWNAVMRVSYKPKNFVYEPLPQEHDLNFWATLATSLIMACNVCYAIKPAGLTEVCGTITVLAALTAIYQIYKHDTPNKSMFALLLLVYVVNICCYLWRYFREGEKQLQNTRAGKNRLQSGNIKRD